MRKPVLLALAVAALGASAGGADKPAVRPAAVAGSWYPKEPAALRKMLGGFLAHAPKAELPGEPAAIIVPHAGYRFSGPTAAAAFKAVAGRKYSRVILLGPSHYLAGAYTGAAVPTAGAFATPLGDVPVDVEACRKLAAGKGFVADDRPHRREHCLEMELPLMQLALGSPRIVPVLTGAMNPALARRVGAALRPLAGKGTLVIVSTDFTHFGPNYGYVPFTDDVPNRLKWLDSLAIDRILAMDALGFVETCQDTRATICGRWAVAVALEMFADHADMEGVLLGYTTSGAMLKDYTNSVSYAAIALCRQAAAPLTAPEQKCLLTLARAQLREHLKTGKPLADAAKRFPLTPRLKKPAPAFVTLTQDGKLRGCIGHVTPVAPLYQSVLTNTVAACSRDPRFGANRITADDEPKVHIEISVLSRHRRVRGIGSIKIGRDGLIVQRGRRRGLLLPQVPVQQKWDLNQYLSGICRKAGLPADAWKDPATRLSRFAAQVFAEPHPETATKPK